MPFVLDASVTLAWCLDDEDSSYAVSVLGELDGDHAFAPSVWPMEVSNGLVVAIRRARLDPDLLGSIERQLVSLPVRVELPSLNRAVTAILTIARNQNLTVYDASYLELATRLSLPLATLDARLRAAAEVVGVQIHE